VAAEGPVSAAVCSVLAALRAGGSATCETLAAGELAEGTAAGRLAEETAAGRGLAAACAEAACGPAIWDWTVGTHGGAGVAVGLDRLGPLLGDRVGLVGDGAGLLGDGVALLVADGVGDGVALLVADGVGDGVAVGVADGISDGVALGVPEGAGDGSALGVVLGLADGDGVVAEADSEGLGSSDALAGDEPARIAAPPAMITPRTARTAARAPTNIRPPRPGHPDIQSKQ
jgi:hypothetical protein